MKIFKIAIYKRWLLTLIISILTVIVYCSVNPAIAKSPVTSVDVFEQVWQTVNDNFFEPQFNGVDWQQIKSKYRAIAAKTHSSEEVSVVINQMLAELNTSHTHFYTLTEPAYYQIAGIFHDYIFNNLKPFLPQNKLEYTGIGINIQKINNQIFIKTILNGSPAEKAGLKVGDRIINIEGKPFDPINSFVNQENKEIIIKIQRKPDSKPQAIAIVPQTFNPVTMFLDAMKASVEIIKRDDKKIGYIHIWSYAGDIYQKQLEQELFDDRLKNVDGLIWDLRDGWGGAEPTYLNPFSAPVPSLTTVFRNGKKIQRELRWRKPVVMLVNQGSRSGKEILAYAFHKYAVGKIVGSKTAGAVVAGSPFIMKDGSLLYLAVADVFVDGNRLEGKGITPDIEIPFTIPYAEGKDPQKEKAIETILSAINQHLIVNHQPLFSQ
jgi:carboxyl-terminal processing protease